MRNFLLPGSRFTTFNYKILRELFNHQIRIFLGNSPFLAGIDSVRRYGGGPEMASWGKWDKKGNN
jgi:hypothetical protein